MKDATVPKSGSTVFTTNGSRLSTWGVILFTGRFGSGKTEAAISYAVSLAQSLKPDMERPDRVILIDLDIVTPYFRSRETAEAMRKEGVEVIAPSVVGQHLDTPALTPQILGAIEQRQRPAVLDVGGDRQGARALGQYAKAISQRGYTMHFVVNPYRPFTDTVEGLARSITEIEESARLQVTSLVSNPNLINETTAERIVEGHALIEEFSRQLGLPIAFICLERSWARAFQASGSKEPKGTSFSRPILILDRRFVHPWEQNALPEKGKREKSHEDHP
jgi:hypothetical protein